MKTILAILAAVWLTGCTGALYKVTTNSMAPTLKPGDEVAVDRAFYKASGIRRFDLVAVKDPTGRHDPSGDVEVYVKRVVALGEEKFEIRGGRFYINDDEIGVPSVIGDVRSAGDFGPVVVPKGEYFVIGDNLGNSFDSRYWRPPTIKEEGIVGVVSIIKDGATGQMREP